VAVIGFDDIADAAEFQPPLTTVRQDFDALGEQAVRRLVDWIDGARPADLLLAPALVIRASA
jgi:DNA-binding LacI/PurR family transcriptional regulator